jgi:hypothetical protein
LKYVQHIYERKGSDTVAVLLTLSNLERALVVRALVSACADAALARELSRHARLLDALRVACGQGAIVASDAGCRLLARLVLREGIQRQDVQAAGGLLARLAGAGVRA